MFKRIRSVLRNNNLLRSLLGLEQRDMLQKLTREVEHLRLQIGDLQFRAARTVDGTLNEAEFQVYSQFGEDGIIQYILKHVGAVPQTFIEFGVENYTESNTRFLLQHCNWRGLIIDGNDDSIQSVRKRDISWRHELTSVCAFITTENINSLFTANGFSGRIGLLSVDIDGNDYWVWDCITAVDPTIVVAEYNSVFGDERAVSVPYSPAFQRSKEHYSNLYWGCSLGALNHLAAKKGYDLVGCNNAGNNAFFVRTGVSSLKPLTTKEAFVESQFRESRDRKGELTFLSGTDRLREIGEMPLIDVTDGSSIKCAGLIL